MGIGFDLLPVIGLSIPYFLCLLYHSTCCKQDKFGVEKLGDWVSVPTLLLEVLQDSLNVANDGG